MDGVEFQNGFQNCSDVSCKSGLKLGASYTSNNFDLFRGAKVENRLQTPRHLVVQ